VLTNRSRLAPRLNKGYSYSSAPPLDLNDFFQGENNPLLKSHMVHFQSTFSEKKNLVPEHVVGMVEINLYQERPKTEEQKEC
jgi:hypothetical protein